MILPDVEGYQAASVLSPVEIQTSPESQDVSATKDLLRVYTTQGPMWHALTGHGPDTNKVPGMDFALLTIIAARRHKGVVQGDLIRLSGQDKRSVPARTQRLHDRGYIEKCVVPGTVRTGFCTLKKFVNREYSTKLHTEDDKGIQLDMPQEVAIDNDATQLDQPTIFREKIPLWNPDQPLPNLLYDIVESTGTQGISTMVS